MVRSVVGSDAAIGVAGSCSSERRSMPPLYISPESQSLLDPSLALLSSPTKISKISRPRRRPSLWSEGSQRFFLQLQRCYCCPSVPRWIERAPPQRLQVTLIWRYLPSLCDSLTVFLGPGSRCQSPQRKVGVLTACCLQKRFIKVDSKSTYCFFDLIVVHFVRVTNRFFAFFFDCMSLRGAESVFPLCRELHHFLTRLAACW